MADGAHAPGTHYRAFLSYSHKDEAFAGRLHRRLESYRLPKRLIGTEGAGGVTIPERLAPIFRDREELSASENLSDRIREALAASDALIVLCSPDAKASHWVNQEIRLFRALHPGRPVFAALINGEPAEAFPQALTESGAEPIAPDFRKGKDGDRLALMKLVAGVSGVPLDALVQRDAQRQTRRVMAITGSSLAAVLIMALLLVTAIRSQREAERQRAEAEGLVEYMLTDLRDRLKGVGRLDVMTAVNARAMQYYGGDTVKGRLLRARILHAMGEDEDKRGDYNASAKAFLHAEAITRKVIAERPDNEEAIFAHSQSEYWVGLSAMRAGQSSEMRQRFLNYKRLADRLAEMNPSNANWTKEVAYAEGNLCTAYLEEPRQPEKSLAYCRAALERMVEADRRLGSPDETQRSIVNRHSWLADAQAATGDLAAALATRRAQQKVIDQLLARDRTNVTNREEWVKARLSLGQQLKKLGQNDEASKWLNEAQKEISALRNIEPRNQMYLKWQSMAEIGR